MGEPTEEAEETESERVVLVVESMLMVMMFLIEGGNVVCSVISFCITQVFGMEKSCREFKGGRERGIYTIMPQHIGHKQQHHHFPGGGRSALLIHRTILIRWVYEHPSILSSQH